MPSLTKKKSFITLSSACDRVLLRGSVCVRASDVDQQRQVQGVQAAVRRTRRQKTSPRCRHDLSKLLASSPAGQYTFP